MFLKYSFDCAFTAGCFVSKCLFNSLGTSAYSDRMALTVFRSRRYETIPDVIFVSPFGSLLFIQRFHSLILANIFFHG